MSIAYAAPMYVGLATLLCSCYSCIECTKDKGRLDTSTKSILSAWCIIVLIISSFIAGVSGQIMIGSTNITHILIVMILVCITLSLSSSMIYWA
jgi:hypothetical protein